MAKHTGYVPLGAVLRPQPNTILVLELADFAMNLNHTGTKVGSPLGDLGIADPIVVVLPALRCWIPMSRPETFGLGHSPGGLLKEVVDGLHLRVVSR